MNSTVENPIWDVAKLVMAFLVVGIHTHSGLRSADADFFLREWLGRFAVPLFFLLAGYFLFQKTQPAERLVPPDSKTVGKYGLRILRMYVLWTCVYLIPQTFIWVRERAAFRQLLIYAEYAIVRGDSYMHLWYLSALCAAIFLIWALHRFCSLPAVGVTAFCLYVFGLLWLPHYYLVRGVVEGSAPLSGFYTLLNRYIGWPRNGMFYAFVFVVLGALLGRNALKVMRGRKVWALTALFAALSFAEVWWIRRQNGGSNATYCALQLALIPATYFLFCALSQICIAPRPVYRTLRKCSTLIYCLHPMVMLLCDLLKKNDIARIFFSMPFTEWIVVYAAAFGLALAWVRLERSPRFRFLRVMH